MKSAPFEETGCRSRGTAPRMSGLGKTAAQKQARILVADDSLLARTVARRLLESEGFEVFEASDGSAVMQLLSRERVDLLLMDLHMPGLGGIDTARWIRRLEDLRGGPRLPILAMTASGSPAERQECLVVGMDAVLPKEFRLDDIFPFLSPGAEDGFLQ